MCGIASIFRFDDRPVSASAIGVMTETVAHRGPDGSGTLLLAPQGAGLAEVNGSSDAWRIALGHRRLSILDLSEAGRQPMPRGDQLWITYNGEAYNYLETRQELAALGHQFHSDTDTEVILAAFEQWGPDCFARFNGMWGLVIVDGRNQAAYFCRDRIGIKPLYYLRRGQTLFVASEIKQFQQVAEGGLQPQRAALIEYLLTGYERRGRTFFADVQQVPPGTWMRLDLRTGELSAPVSYWNPESIQATIHRYEDAGDHFRAELQDAVRLSLRSDVPVGCALSGGLDSSIVARCIADELAPTGAQVQTFSVVFPGSEINEQPYVDAVVGAINANSHLYAPTVDDFLHDLDRFTWIHDEPVGGFAQYAAYGLARITREAGVPVTLNGQGGDEVLAGYWQSCFLYLRSLLRQGYWPRLAKHFVGAALPGGNREIFRQIPGMIRRYRSRKAGTRRSAELVEQETESNRSLLAEVMGMSQQERRVYEIRQMYLPRLLKWDDRNFMAYSVEGRYPLLDHRLIETCLSFSGEVLYHHGWIKEPLRRAAEGRLPKSIVRRRTKWGFETPLHDWLSRGLRARLQDWVAADAPIWDYFDHAEAQSLAQKVWSNPHSAEEELQVLLRLFLADRWLRVFFVEPSLIAPA